jgi:hypothetical protein
MEQQKEKQKETTEQALLERNPLDAVTRICWYFLVSFDEPIELIR